VVPLLVSEADMVGTDWVVVSPQETINTEFMEVAESKGNTDLIIKPEEIE